MKSLHTPLGYMVDAVFNHYDIGDESCNVVGATVIKVDRRYGKQNSGRDPVQPLVTVKLQNGETKSFDASYVTKVYKPKNFVHIRHVKKKYYEYDCLGNGNKFTIYQFHCVSRVQKKLVGSPISLIGLAHDKSKFRDYPISHKKACNAFIKMFALKDQSGLAKYDFRVKEKVLIRWFEQNFTRFQSTAKFLNAEATRQLMEEEQDYWDSCGYDNAEEAFDSLRRQLSEIVTDKAIDKARKQSRM